MAVRFAGFVKNACTSCRMLPRLSPKFSSTHRTASLSIRSLTNVGMSAMNCSTCRTTGGISSHSAVARTTASPPKTMTIAQARETPRRTRRRTRGSSASAMNRAIAM